MDKHREDEWLVIFMEKLTKLEDVPDSCSCSVHWRIVTRPHMMERSLQAWNMEHDYVVPYRMDWEKLDTDEAITQALTALEYDAHANLAEARDREVLRA